MVLEYQQLAALWPSFSMILRPPETEEDLEQLIGLANFLMDQTGGDEDHPLIGLLDLMGTLIEHYEQAHLPEPQGDPVGCLKYLMAEHGVRQKDLTELGSPGVISETLSGKRELNKRQIKALSERFQCSPALFI